MNLSKFLTCLLLTVLFISPCTGQTSWEQLSNHPSEGVERTFTFEIDGLIYVGGGTDFRGTIIPDVHVFDPTTNTWTKKSDFPGTSRRNAFSFQLDGIGYIGTGYDGFSHLSDFWKYDPADDTWTQLPDFPGGERSHALAIAGENKAYVLTGGRSTDEFFTNDMWEFDPATGIWTAMEEFPGFSRWRAFGWIIGQKLYAGGGAKFPRLGYRDIYSFDLVTGTWDEAEIAQCPTSKSVGGFFFTIQGKGFYGEGSSGLEVGTRRYGTKVFTYDPVLDTWANEVEFIGPARALGFSLVVDNKAILGLGRNYETEINFNDVYSFTPGIRTSTNIAEKPVLKVFPNPVSSSKLSVTGEFNANNNVIFTLSDTRGVLQQLSTEQVEIVGPDLIQLDIGYLAKGIYQLGMVYDQQSVSLRFVKQ